MTFGFKLSHRLARGFWAVGMASVLAGCTGELVSPPDPTAPVSSISIAPTTASVTVDETVQLSAVLRDAHGAALSGRAVTWSSEAASIATVSASGVVAGAD